MVAARSLAALVPALGLLATAGAADGPNLKQSEAEADRLDPGWRLADLEAKRAKVAPEADGAPRVLEVIRSLPKDWADFYRDPDRPKPVARIADAKVAWDAMTTALDGDPTGPIAEEILAPLRVEEAELRPMLARARELERYPTGRYSLTHAHNPLETPFPHLLEIRQAARLLSFDGHVRALTGDIDGALASARAILGVARSIGDEPSTVSQLVRMAVEAVAVELIERTLARGEASDAALAATQSALADEAAQPLLLHAMRGERAMNYDLTGKVASGEIDPDALGGGKAAPPPSARKPIPAMREDQAICLHLLTRAVEIAKKPLPDQPDLWDAWERDSEPPKGLFGRPKHPLVSLLMPALGAIPRSHMRTRAILRAAETMVGLERVRRATGHWPKAGDPLVPAFKDGPPADPFTGKPILWKPTPTGLVVYSVGYDRGDHGGNLENKNIKRPGTDIGFRLWDVERRPKAAPLGR